MILRENYEPVRREIVRWVQNYQMKLENRISKVTFYETRKFNCGERRGFILRSFCYISIEN